MLSLIQLDSDSFKVNLNRPIDISLKTGKAGVGPIAWYLGAAEIKPVTEGDWIGKVSEGAKVNFNTIKFSPHAHATHTESYGHISKEFYSVSNCLKRFFFKCKLISIAPQSQGEDRIITQKLVAKHLQKSDAEALVIRTLPNDSTKKNRNYDHTNWPYLSVEAASYIRKCGIKHLLIDLPSVDREEGEVWAHRAFWNYPEHPDKQATITEFVFVPDEVQDGSYLLNLQMAHLENDAVPSRPVLYAIES